MYYRAMARIPSLHLKPPASERSQVLLRVCVFAIAVALERRRIARGSPRRVRRVDARTGADPSLRQTIIVLVAQRAGQWLLGRAIPGPGAALQRMKPKLEHEIERVRLEHADPGAQQDAIMRVYQQRQAGSVNMFLPALIRSAAVAAINRCPVPFLPQRRTLADLLAGTKLVRNGPSRWTRWRRRLNAR